MSILKKIFQFVKKRWKKGVIAMIVLGIGFIETKKTVLKPLPEYETATGRIQDLSQTLEVSGEIGAEQKAVLKFQTLGKLGWGGIAAISLLVGGVGIMNIMLVSVTERTREIGLRKAVGATPQAILVQFLIKAVLLSVVGGIIGTVLGVGIGLVLNNFLPVHTPVWVVLIAFGVSAGVGIVFGVFPARKASKLSPIEALRYE